MSNSNFTPETLPSFPLSTLLPSLQWRVENGWKDSQRVIGRTGLTSLNTFLMVRNNVAQREEKNLKRQWVDICNKMYDVLLFILPYTLPCGLLGGKACCFLASAAWAGGCLLQHNGTWLCWQLAPHAASSPSLLTRSNMGRLQNGGGTVGVQSGWDFLIMSSVLTVWLQGFGLAKADIYREAWLQRSQTWTIPNTPRDPPWQHWLTRRLDNTTQSSTLTQLNKNTHFPCSLGGVLQRGKNISSEGRMCLGVAKRVTRPSHSISSHST